MAAGEKEPFWGTRKCSGSTLHFFRFGRGSRSLFRADDYRSSRWVSACGLAVTEAMENPNIDGLTPYEVPCIRCKQLVPARPPPPPPVFT